MVSSTDSLDPQQRAAVEAQEPAIAVLAGPGSGKTRVLAYRARHLLSGDRKSQALLLTFTNKAAAEMKARALGAANIPKERIEAVNYHTFGLKLLQAHGDLVGIAPSFEILDEDEIEAMQREIASDNIARDYARLRLTGQKLPEEVQEFGVVYEKRKRQEGVLDFDDLIFYSARLLQTRPDVAQTYGRAFPHVLVDEFQDTNASHFELVRALVAHGRTISLFADDDQAIFGFTGADLRHVRKFVKALNAKEYPLTVNYRCRHAIVGVANKLLDAEPSASNRRMTAHNSGGEVVVKGFDNTQVEAAWLAADLSATIAQGTKPQHCAILVNTRFRAEDLMGHLLASGVPISDWLGAAYPAASRRTLRACLAVVRDTMRPRQRTALEKLYALPKSQEENTEAFLQGHMRRGGIAELMAAATMLRSGQQLSSVLTQVQKSLACLDERAAESITPIVENVKALEGGNAHFTVEHLLSDLALGGTGGAPTEGGGVKVATLHRTKGLQWPTVYLVGLEEGQLPFYKATSAEDLAGQRRVCFVGLCRAESRLVITRLRSHKGYAKAPSRFLGEMGLV
jgi:DNA helicase II / ATP-dependent DNA helicase PcrA